MKQLSNQTILYLSFSRLKTSVNAVYIKGLKCNNINVISFEFPQASPGRLFKILKIYFQNRTKADLIMVGYDSPQIIIALRLLTGKKIIYNALCSKYERLIVSRNLAAKFSIKAIYYWLIDFLSFQFSQLVMLETQHQIDYIQKLFKISPKKCFLAWTGVDEGKFHFKPSKAKFERFTVLFRGRFLPEAGVEYAIQAAKKLEEQPINFLILGNGILLNQVQSLINKLKPKNLKLITEFLSDDELLAVMQKSHLSLGQLGNHPRLVRTIPHKAYESLIMKIPYLTARNPAVMELFAEGETCLAFSPADADDLAKKILWAKEHPRELEEIGQRGYKLYQQKLTPKILASKLLKRV